MAVCGTYYVQASTIPLQALLASFPVGAFATAVLVVNNLRDVDTDRSAGKRTMAVRFGSRAARFEYAGLIGFAYLMLPVLWKNGASPAAALLPLLTLPLALGLVRLVATVSDGPTLNGVLARTAAVEVGFALLLAAGILM